MCHDRAQPLPRPSCNSDPSPATPKLVAIPQLNSGHYINLQPRTSSIVSQPQAWSNPGISDLSPSLDETPNLVWPLLVGYKHIVVVYLLHYISIKLTTVDIRSTIVPSVACQTTEGEYHLLTILLPTNTL